LTNGFEAFCKENNLEINITKTKAMYVNCTAKLQIGKKFVETVNVFKYLGLILSNNSKQPDVLLQARINKA
jgi:hypothetical protein